jgi:hypothetical protein
VRTVLVLLTALSGSGCQLPPRTQGFYTIVGDDSRRHAPVPPVSQAEWTLSRARLERLRKELPRRPYVGRVQMGVVDPRSGRRLQARGAVAVSPDRAARLILLGPAGTTALDLWVTRDRFRFTIPSIKLDKRGGSDPAHARGLPVGLLRWWFLAPMEGQLLVARSSATETAFLLRDGAAFVTVRTDRDRFVALRRAHGRMEGLEWIARGLTPHAGARGQYIDGESGLHVHVVIEEVLPEEPDPEAFLEPDEERGTTL